MNRHCDTFGRLRAATWLVALVALGGCSQPAGIFSSVDSKEMTAFTPAQTVLGSGPVFDVEALQGSTGGVRATTALGVGVSGEVVYLECIFDIETTQAGSPADYGCTFDAEVTVRVSPVGGSPLGSFRIGLLDRLDTRRAMGQSPPALAATASWDCGSGDSGFIPVGSYQEVVVPTAPSRTICSVTVSGSTRATSRVDYSHGLILTVMNPVEECTIRCPELMCSPVLGCTLDQDAVCFNDADCDASGGYFCGPFGTCQRGESDEPCFDDFDCLPTHECTSESFDGAGHCDER